jgi:hypothetical protein
LGARSLVRVACAAFSAIALGNGAAFAADAPNLEGVWGMVQHDRLGAPLVSAHRSIENRSDEFFLDPGPAQTLFVSRYRAMPGKARDYMSFVRTEMYPVMKKAKENGTFSGLEVTTSVQGGEPGIITLNISSSGSSGACRT